MAGWKSPVLMEISASIAIVNGKSLSVHVMSSSRCAMHPCAITSEAACLKSQLAKGPDVDHRSGWVGASITVSGLNFVVPNFLTDVTFGMRPGILLGPPLALVFHGSSPAGGC